ncbi:uncharacterized protein KIAA1614 homolog isoform X2 [Rana temporaria]|uniref:uncharacterized protein KIAA1614 homolog isoform X2 n=1 Tax=Rana temporaria TaxID=8407 RepID=UPI001AACE7B6|nr:uncharacterized protein KIAA1614 homolog isoform X2 [Rana temporaria]
MAVEVNPRQCIPAGEEKPSAVYKPSRKVRAAGGRTSTEQLDKPVKHEEEYGARTSVLQSKVKALKEKNMKEKKETNILKDEGGEKDKEDVLVSPQLRTYLTEELLECTKNGRYSGVHQGSWGSDELWGTYSSDGSSDAHSNGCKIVNSSNHSQNPQNNSSLCLQEQLQPSSNDLSVPENTTARDSISLTLAEKVERNRQELRSKFGKSVNRGGEITHSQGQTSKSRIITGDVDGDLGLEIPVIEECGELSARHEQAKQLLQRARMKAKGASPLRASHCVLAHPHSQPTLRRGPNISGAVTDGGSLSDSSSSEYSTWQKGFRGSSPSHVRFQDESEREAEERYRERQQVPQKVSTPPPKRQPNGPISWTEQLSPSGNGQCGTCSSYVKGTGTSPAATHGTNLRNVHLGSKMTQDGSVSCPLGVKPSPHWILPTQPWRMYTELIRETHIGSDSTPDSSGEDDGNRSHNKKSRDWGMHRHCRNNSANATPEQGAKVHLLDTYSESEIRVGRSLIDQNNGNGIGTSSNVLTNRGKNKSNHLEPIGKTSETNREKGTAARSYCVDSVRTGLRKSPQNTEAKSTQRHKNSALEFDTKPNTSIQETGIGAIVLNIDTKDGNSRMHLTDCRAPVTPVIQCTSQAISSPFPSGHVPAPPSGKAPIMMPSRSRLSLRPGGISQQPHNSQEGGIVQAPHEKRESLSKPVPNSKKTTQEALGASDGHQLSQGMTSKDNKSRERTQKLKKHTENKKTKEVKENGDVIKHQEPRELDRPYTSSRQKDYERHPSFKDQRDKNHGSGTLSKEQEKNETHHSKREEKCTENSGINGQLTCSSNTNTGSGQCFRENSFHCQTSDLGISTKDRYPELPDEGSLQPAVKKGDIRSGMRKIFSSIGLTSRPKLERFQSSSLEQISSPGSSSANGDSESFDGSVKSGKIKKSPSLQSLKLMSPFHLPRKASSVQNLLGKSDRSSVYITGDMNTAPRRTLSVEDIGSPGKARALGKVAEVYPDGTRLLELQRPENGTFGFRISAGNGRPDSGIYVQEMSDPDTAKLYSGLLRVGDEVLEVNGTKVSILGKTRLTELMNREPVLSLRVLHQRRTKC